MKVEKINETSEEIRLHIEADAELMAKAFTDGLDAFLTQYQMVSAEGETAYDKIIAALGEEDGTSAVYSAVINYLVPFALEEFGVLPLATYGIESVEAPEADKPFAFDMTVLPKPEFDLSCYDPATVSVPARYEVQESDLEEQMAMLVREYVAMNSGKKATDEDLKVPELTDEWVAEHLHPMGVSTVADLKERFRQTSEEELAARYEQAKMAAAMEEYAKRFEGEISKTMQTAMIQELYETFLAQLAQEGLGLEAFMAQQGLTEDEIRDSLAAQADNQLIQGFILDAIFRHEDLKLELADVMGAMRSIAPGREQETVEVMEKTGRSFLLKEAASRMKAGQWIMENTTFVVE